MMTEWLLLLVGCAHTNPPITQPFVWTDAGAEAIARQACYDCHSNETRWPWYDRVPLARGLFASQVEAGRRQMNFSTWDKGNRGALDATEVIDAGLMPPAAYVRHHPPARLDAAQRLLLVRSLEAGFEGQPPRGRPTKDGGSDVTD